MFGVSPGFPKRATGPVAGAGEAPVRPWGTRPEVGVMPEPGTLALIARTLKSWVEHLSATDVRQAMESRYMTLRLMDAHGEWTMPEVCAHARTRW